MICWNLEKVGADVSYFQSLMHSEYDSAESIADSDLEDGELRKMLASPSRRLCILSNANRNGESCCIVTGERSNCKKVLPLIQGKAGCLVHLRNRVHRGNLLHCFHLEMKNWEINSRVLFSKTLTRQMWEDLFLRERKIICSVKQNLNL